MFPIHYGDFNMSRILFENSKIVVTYDEDINDFSTITQTLIEAHREAHPYVDDPIMGTVVVKDGHLDSYRLPVIFSSSDMITRMIKDQGGRDIDVARTAVLASTIIIQEHVNKSLKKYHSGEIPEDQMLFLLSVEKHYDKATILISPVEVDNMYRSLH